MSAFPDAPSHFADWLARRHPALREMGVEAVSSDDFVPRRIYGSYIPIQFTAGPVNLEGPWLAKVEYAGFYFKSVLAFRS